MEIKRHLAVYHIVTKMACFYHIRSFRQIRSSLNDAYAMAASAWIRWILFYMVLLWIIRPASMQRVQSAHAVRWQSRGGPSLSSSSLFHCTPQAASLASGVHLYLKMTLVGAIGPSHQPTTSLYAHPLLIIYLFRDTTYHLVLVLSASQPHGSGTPCLFNSVKTSYSTQLKYC